MNECRTVIIGAGGHALSVCDAVESTGGEVEGFLDDGLAPGTLVAGKPVLGGIDLCTQLYTVQFVLAIGNNETRKQIAERYPLNYRTVVHKRAYVCKDARLGAGTVVLAGAVVGAHTVTGEHVIINTLASADHQNTIERYAHLSPHAALGGNVFVGEACHIGIGACIRNCISVCAGTVVGAGAVVVSDITERGVYIGVPARRMGSAHDADSPEKAIT